MSTKPWWFDSAEGRSNPYFSNPQIYNNNSSCSKQANLQEQQPQPQHRARNLPPTAAHLTPTYQQQPQHQRLDNKTDTKPPPSRISSNNAASQKLLKTSASTQKFPSQARRHNRHVRTSSDCVILPSHSLQQQQQKTMVATVDFDSESSDNDDAQFHMRVSSDTKSKSTTTDTGVMSDAPPNLAHTASRSAIAVRRTPSANSSTSSSSSSSSSSFSSPSRNAAAKRNSSSRRKVSTLGTSLHVLEEILLTERAFVSDMKLVVTGYLYVMRREHRLDSERIALIFGNVEELLQLHQQLLSKIELNPCSATHVAKCFCNASKQFSTAYGVYCSNYPKSIELLDKLMSVELNPEFRTWLERLKTLNRQALPLPAYLLKPVQRILKYHLLFDKINETFVAAGCEVFFVKKALTQFKTLAQHINEVKKQHDAVVRKLELAHLVVGIDADEFGAFGSLVLEEDLRVHGVRAKRHILLFDRALLVTKKRKTGDGALAYKGHVQCANMLLVEFVPEQPLAFHVIPFHAKLKQQYTLIARDEVQKRKWIREIKRRILENYHMHIPENAKRLLLSAGDENAKNLTSPTTAMTTPCIQVVNLHTQQVALPQPATSRSNTLNKQKSTAVPAFNSFLLSLRRGSLDPPQQQLLRGMSSSDNKSKLKKVDELLLARSVSSEQAQQSHTGGRVICRRSPALSCRSRKIGISTEAYGFLLNKQQQQELNNNLSPMSAFTASESDLSAIVVDNNNGKTVTVQQREQLSPMLDSEQKSILVVKQQQQHNAPCMLVTPLAQTVVATPRTPARHIHFSFDDHSERARRLSIMQAQGVTIGATVSLSAHSNLADEQRFISAAVAHSHRKVSSVYCTPSPVVSGRNSRSPTNRSNVSGDGEYSYDSHSINSSPVPDSGRAVVATATTATRENPRESLQSLHPITGIIDYTETASNGFLDINKHDKIVAAASDQTSSTNTTQFIAASPFAVTIINAGTLQSTTALRPVIGPKPAPPPRPPQRGRRRPTQEISFPKQEEAAAPAPQPDSFNSASSSIANHAAAQEATFVRVTDSGNYSQRGIDTLPVQQSLPASVTAVHQQINGFSIQSNLARQNNHLITEPFPVTQSSKLQKPVALELRSNSQIVEVAPQKAKFLARLSKSIKRFTNNYSEADDNTNSKKSSSAPSRSTPGSRNGSIHLRQQHKQPQLAKTVDQEERNMMTLSLAPNDDNADKKVSGESGSKSRTRTRSKRSSSNVPPSVRRVLGKPFQVTAAALVHPSEHFGSAARLQRKKRLAQIQREQQQQQSKCFHWLHVPRDAKDFQTDDELSGGGGGGGTDSEMQYSSAVAQLPYARSRRAHSQRRITPSPKSSIVVDSDDADDDGAGRCTTDIAPNSTRVPPEVGDEDISIKRYPTRPLHLKMNPN